MQTKTKSHPVHGWLFAFRIQKLLTSSRKRRHIANRNPVKTIHGDVLLGLEEPNGFIDRLS
jgi:hypothetical protein